MGKNYLIDTNILLEFVAGALPKKSHVSRNTKDFQPIEGLACVNPHEI